jgi:hypothetical protein
MRPDRRHEIAMDTVPVLVEYGLERRQRHIRKTTAAVVL